MPVVAARMSSSAWPQVAGESWPDSTTSSSPRISAPSRARVRISLPVESNRSASASIWSYLSAATEADEDDESTSGRRGVRGMSRSLIGGDVLSGRDLGQHRSELGRQVVGLDAGDGDAGTVVVVGGEGVPAVVEQHPRDDAHRGGRALGDLGGQDAQPAAALRVDGGEGGAGLGLAEGLAVAADRALGLATRTGTRSERPERSASPTASASAYGTSSRAGTWEADSGRSSGTAVTRPARGSTGRRGTTRSRRRCRRRWTGSRPHRRTGGARPSPGWRRPRRRGRGPAEAWPAGRPRRGVRGRRPRRSPGPCGAACRRGRGACRAPRCRPSPRSIRGSRRAVRTGSRRRWSCPRWAGGRTAAVRHRPGRPRGAARGASARVAGPCRRGSSPAGRGAWSGRWSPCQSPGRSTVSQSR